MRQTLQKSKRIVVKVGTSTLTYENGRLNLKTSSSSRASSFDTDVSKLF